jgi:hypothetical protein
VTLSGVLGSFLKAGGGVSGCGVLSSACSSLKRVRSVLVWEASGVYKILNVKRYSDLFPKIVRQNVPKESSRRILGRVL